MKNLPTPKTLEEAIRNGMMYGPLNQVMERTYLHVKDFLAQRFGAAVLQYPESEKALMELYERIIKEEV